MAANSLAFVSQDLKVRSPPLAAALIAYPIVEVMLGQFQGIGLKRLATSTPCPLTLAVQEARPQVKV